MNMEVNLLISNVSMALLVSLAGAATTLVILFPPTNTMWRQRSFLDKFLRIFSAGLTLVLYLKIATYLFS